MTDSTPAIANTLSTSASLARSARSRAGRALRAGLCLLLLGLALPAAAVDLLISNLTDAPDPATRGGKIVYTASVTNNDSDSATGVTLTFALDAATDFVSVSDPGRCAYDGASRSVVCTFATVNGETADADADVIVTSVTVASTGAAGLSVTATATVASAAAELNTGNNTQVQTTTIENGADLSLSLSALPTSAAAGASVVFTAATSNLGPNVAGAVSVAVTLSPNLSYSSASGSGWTCAPAGQVVTCTRASGALGALPSIAIGTHISGASTGIITTTGVVSISGSATDFNNLNDASTVDVNVTAGADLSIAKTASTSVPAAGAAMTFTLAPRNAGPFAATDVSVSDTLPAGFSGIGASGTGWSCGVVGQAVTCTRASLAVGATDDIIVNTTTPAVLSNTGYTNTASVTSTTDDPDSANNSASRSLTVLLAGVDLSITKSKTPNPVARFGALVSTMFVSNAGPAAAASGEIVVEEDLPAGETYVNAVGSGANWACGAQVLQKVSCTYNAALAVGASTQALKLTTTATAAGTLTNNACAIYTASAGPLTDQVPGNNCASAISVSTTAPASIDLRTTKTVNPAQLAWNADTVTYTVTVTNDGPGSADGIVLNDPIPGHTSGTVVTVDTLGGTSNATFTCTTGATVVCTQSGGSMAMNETAVFTIAAKRPLLDGAFTNIATASSTNQGDVNPANNAGSVAVTIDPVADLELFSAVSPTTALAGTDATFVLTVNNNGPSTAAGVTLTQVLSISSGSMSFGSVTSGSGTCAFDANTWTVSCNFNAMARNATASATVVLRPNYEANAAPGRTVTSNSTVTSTTQDADSTNNSKQTVLTVSAAALDLLVNNTDSPDPLGFVPLSASPSGSDNIVTYRNTITNRGPSVASGLVLRYTMTPPAGKATTFLGGRTIASGASYVNYCNNVGIAATSAAPLTVTCTFPGSLELEGSNATTILDIDFYVDSAPSTGGDIFASSVEVTSSEFDTFLDNNAVTQNTTVKSRVDLVLTKSALAYNGSTNAATATAQVRQPFYWLLTLTNNGPGNSAVTTLTDTLPANVTVYTGGAGLPAPYNAAPYTNSGLTWSSTNATPGSGACSRSGRVITCPIGLLESGKSATVLVPVISSATGARENCASATTTDVDRDPSNNTGKCSTVTIQASSIGGTVYADANNDGAKAGGEAGIGAVVLTLTGTDVYGNAVNVSATSNGSGVFAIDERAPGVYALTETHPSGWLDGIDSAGTAGGAIAAVPGDAISAITLPANTQASGYNFGELAPATLSGYVFVDSNSNAVRDGGESVGIAGITMTLTGTDDLGAVNRTTTTGVAGAYSFTSVRPGTYQIAQAVIGGLTHTGMTVGSKGGNDGVAVVAAGTAVPGAAKRSVSAIVLAIGDSAQNYDFGESGQGLSGHVYADLNNNGVKDAGESGIAGVGVTLSGLTSGNVSICAAMSPNPCTVQTGSDGAYSFTGLVASDASGYTITEQSQAAAPLSYYADGIDSVGTVGGSMTNDRVSGIVMTLGQFGTGYNFGERGAVISGAVYHDKNDDGSVTAGEPGLAGVTLTLSGQSAGALNVCTLLPSCTTTSASDGSFKFEGLPTPNGAGYTVTQTQPVDYSERSNTVGAGGGSAGLAGANSVFTGIAPTPGLAASGYLFGEKSASLSGFAWIDANNDGVKDGAEDGLAGVTMTLSGTTASGAGVCTLIASCSAVTGGSGAYRFDNLPNAGAGGYTVSEQAQTVAPLASLLDGRITTGSNCGACSVTATSPNAIGAIALVGTQSFTGYNFGELRPASIAGSVYHDINADQAQGAGEALAGVSLTLSGNDDRGAVSLSTTSAVDGSYSFGLLRPSDVSGYTVSETQPVGLADFSAATGTRVGSVASVATGSAAANAVSAIVVGSGALGVAYDFRERGSSIAGVVYIDRNNDGVQQTGEDGIAGVTLTISGTMLNGSPYTAAVTSANDGAYVFPGLMGGTYAIVEQQPISFEDGRESGGSAGGVVNSASFNASPASNTISAIVLAPAVAATAYNFGELPMAAGGRIAGQVYLDLNDNGVRDAGEAPLEGVLLTLRGINTKNQNVLLTTLSLADGSYAFADLVASAMPGYTVTQTQGALYLDGKTTVASANPGAARAAKPVAAGAGDEIAGIVLLDDAQLSNYNFGERPASLAGVVYVDANDNGVRDAGEAGLGAVSLSLTGADGAGRAVTRQTLSGADGSYLFDGLASGVYALSEVQPASHQDGRETAGSAGGVALNRGFDADALNNTIGAIRLAPGVAGAGYNFGERSVAAISGDVYLDQNANGVRDADETGIAGVTVRLTGVSAAGAPVNLSAASDGQGRFAFDAVPPSGAAGYTLAEIQPAGYADGKTSVAAGQPGAANGAKPVAAGQEDRIGAIVLAPDAALGGYRFGELAKPVSAGAIGGRVYVDANNNGLADSGESGIAGVTLRLTGTDSKGATISRETLSGADGKFGFDALAASAADGYRLTQVQPAGYTDGATTSAGLPGSANARKPVGVGDHDSVLAIVLAEGRQLDGYLFGEIAVPQLKPPFVNGYVWLDRTHDRVRPLNGDMAGQADWTVQLRRNGDAICTVQTDIRGFYQFDNLRCPGYESSGLPTGSGFSIAFSKDGSRLPAVPMSGGGRGQVAPSGGLITNITLNPNDQVVEQNLPLDPAGVVYDVLTRRPVAGALVSISGPGGFVAARHLVGGDAAQAQQVGADGLYQFLLQNDFPSGPYVLSVVAPAGYAAAPSALLPACNGTPVVGLSPSPALVQASDFAPALEVPTHTPGNCVGMVAGGARSTQYYFSFNITNGGSAPILNNHIPIDPLLGDGLVLTKTTSMVNAARAALVPYTITATNTRALAAHDVVLRDRMPPGFKYRSGSARIDGVAVEPRVDGRSLSWPARVIDPRQKVVLTLVLVVGAGVGEGEYVNQADAANAASGKPLANSATATVRIVPDASLDCSDVIGKVFDDVNVNGYQDEGEAGIAAVRVVTARGLLVTTDAQGRFHVPCAAVPNEQRGSNFVMKLDERTLPSGYRVTTENPRDVRLTRGKLAKLNFGATIHRVVRIELSDAAYDGASDQLLAPWNQQVQTMIEQLKLKPSVVRIGYQQGSAGAAVATRRAEALRAELQQRWGRLTGMYRLSIELEVAP